MMESELSKKPQNKSMGMEIRFTDESTRHQAPWQANRRRRYGCIPLSHLGDGFARAVDAREKRR